MSRPIDAILLGVAGVLLAACAVPAGASPDAGSPSAPRPRATAPALATVPSSPAALIGEVPEPIIAALMADVVDRAGVEPEAIEVLRAETVTWNDGSLGCPEPGMSYTMALIDGYHVVLAAADDEFDYRVTGDGSFRLCENGGRPAR